MNFFLNRHFCLSVRKKVEPQLTPTRSEPQIHIRARTCGPYVFSSPGTCPLNQLEKFSVLNPSRRNKYLFSNYELPY